MLQKAKTTKSSVHAKPTRKRSSTLEPLEERIAPAVTVAVVGGQLQVTLGAGSDSVDVATNGTTGTIEVISTSLNGGTPDFVTGVTAGIQVIFHGSNQALNVNDTAQSFSAASGGAFLLTSLPSLNTEAIFDSTGGNTFDVSNFTASAACTFAAADTFTATKTAGFTLSSTALQATDGLNLTFVSGRVTQVHLTDTTPTGGNIFLIDQTWTGTATLTGPAMGTGVTLDGVTVSKAGGFNLSNGTLTDTTGDGMTLTLSNIGTANLTDSSVAGGNTFTVGGWTGLGMLTNNGLAGDTLLSTKTTGYTIVSPITGMSPQTGSISSGDNMSLTLSGAFPTANLTDSSSMGAANAFNVNGWTGGGTLTGPSTDTVFALKPGGFTLGSTLTDSADSMNLALSGIGLVHLTDSGGTSGGHSFDVSGWQGGGVLTNSESTPDILVASKTASFTLTNGEVSSSDNMSLSLIGFGTANLTDTAGGSHTFTVSGWSGGGSLTSQGGSDTLSISEAGSFTLTNTSVSYGAHSLGLSGIGTANLTDTTGGSDTFTVTGWSGGGSLTSQGGSDTLSISEAGSFTLTNTSVSYGAHSLGLSGIGTANLTDTTGGSDTFTVSGWSGGGSLTSQGGSDTMSISEAGSFTLTNNSVSYGTHSLGLSGIGTANLTDTTGGSDTFTVTGWSGGGSLTSQGGSDTMSISEAGSFTLTNTSVSYGAHSLGLSGIGTANLTDTTGGSDTFTVTGWSGGGSLTSEGGPDTLTISEAGSFTLTNTSVSYGSESLGLSGIGTANLTDTAGGSDTFTVTGWSGGGSLTSQGGSDTLSISEAGSFTLTNSAVSYGAHSLGLSGIGTANLTDTTGGSDTFTVTGWSGGGSLTSEGGSDTLTISEAGSFTLTNTSVSYGAHSLGLSGIGTANLTDTTGGSDTFTVTGWSGGGSLTSQGGSDTMNISEAGSFTLTNSSVSYGSESLGLSGIGTANLTDTTGGSDTFTVTGWSGGGSLTSQGGPDTMSISEAGSFTLTNNSVSYGAESLGLSGIGTANLTDTTGGSDTFTVTGWSGGGSLTSQGGSDTMSISEAGGFTLTNSSVSYGTESLGLSGIGTANLTDTSTAGATDTFTVSGWSGGGTLTGLVTETVAASKAGGFGLGSTLTDTKDSMSLGLNGIGIADLTDSSIAGGNTFTITGWTGTGALTNDGAGGDTVSVSKSASYTLTDAAVSSSDNMSLTLSAATPPVSLGLAGTGGFTAADLTDTGGSHSFTVSGWTHKGSLTGAAGDSVIASEDVNKFILTDNSLAATDGLALVLSDVTTATLSVSNATFGPTIFNATGYSGTLTATGGSPTPKTAGLAPLGNIFYGGSGHNTLIGGTDQDRYILQGLATESDILEEPTTDTFTTFNGYYEIGNSIDFSHMTTPTETVGGVKIGVNVNLNDISPSGVPQFFDPALATGTAAAGEAGTLTLMGNPGSFDELAGSPFKDTLIGNDALANPSASKILSKLVTLIYSGGDTTAEDTIQTGHGGAYVIYGKHLPFTSQTEPVPSIVFQLPTTVPYFATEPSLTPPPTITATEPGKYTDNFDNLISITLSGPGSVAVTYNSLTDDPESLTLTGTTSKSVLSIKILGVVGDITVGSITDNVSGLASIDLGPGVSLGDGTNPALSVMGALGSLTVGGLNQASNLTAASFGSITSTGPIVGSSITTTGKIGNITVKLTGATGSATGIAGSQFSAESIGNIHVSVAGAAGDLTSGVAINGSTFTTTGGNIGMITGSVTDVTGSTGPAVIFSGSSATVFLDSAFTADGNIAGITATATGVGKSTGVLNLTGVVASQFTATGNIGAVHVTETATGKGVNATIAGLDGVSNDPVLIQAGGSIASVSVIGSVTDTNIFAGADLGSTSVKKPTTNAGLSTISIGTITITGSLTSSTAGAFAIAATGDIGTVTVDGAMSGYALAAGLDAVADSANDNGRIAEVIVKGQYSNSSIVAGVQSDTNSSSTTPYTWGSLSDNAGTSLAGVTQTSRIGAIILGAATVQSSVTTSVVAGATMAHDSAIEAMALTSIKVGVLAADTSFTAAGYIDELGGAEAAMDTLVRAGSLS